MVTDHKALIDAALLSAKEHGVGRVRLAVGDCKLQFDLKQRTAIADPSSIPQFPRFLDELRKRLLNKNLFPSTEARFVPTAVVGEAWRACNPEDAINDVWISRRVRQLIENGQLKGFKYRHTTKANGYIVSREAFAR